MSSGACIKTDSNLLKKECIHKIDKTKSKKRNIKSCNKYIGEFIFDAQSCDNITKPSSESCWNAQKDIYFHPCKKIKKEYITAYSNCNGRLIHVNVNLKNIKPNKIIIVGVLLYENNKLYAFRVRKIHTGCLEKYQGKTFNAGEFCFIVMENRFCKMGKFRAKVIYHYVNF